MPNCSTDTLQMPYKFLRVISDYRPRLRRRLERHLDNIVRAERPSVIQWEHMTRAISRMHHDNMSEESDIRSTDFEMCERSLESYKAGRFRLIEDVINEIRRRPA